ncbi:PTS sugar transporter subunit IIB [Parasalinivibrio latis]|uniref:PTS sugar transporter subunit IIB n=1 Tax=Parasalinivibrio latis TaxID=2952610 RepID=UPI0030E46BC2
MKKILLICDMGMSTSLVVKRMQEAAQAQGIEAQIEAKGSQDFDDCAADFDCYLLAPQISYKLAEFQGIAQSHGRPISLINMMDYGMTDGKKILSQALTLIEA